MSGLVQIGQAYWLDELDEAQTYDDVTVTMKMKAMITGLIIREFTVQKLNKVIELPCNYLSSAQVGTRGHLYLSACILRLRSHTVYKCMYDITFAV